jgi:hypothetical protein
MMLAAGSMAGCSAGEASEAREDAASTGTFNLPLLARVDGQTYRLQGNLYVSGPVFTYVDIDADTEMVSVSLPAGDYYANLWSFSLLRDDGSGNFVAVDARLVSSSFARFSIFNQTTTTVSFQFETDGQIVTVGTGQLNVDVDVEVTPPACTLLGDDCGAGAWCAPSELTGRPLACISEGAVPEGEACRSPLDCAANTSCFDFGQGPKCTRLCLSADFDEPCGIDGQCTAQGVEYGVCAPME